MRHTGHARRLPSWEEAGNGLRIFAVALHDTVRARLGLQRAYLRLLAPRGSGVLALGHMTRGDYETLMDSRPEVMLGGWQNRVVASTVFEHARSVGWLGLVAATACYSHVGLRVHRCSSV
jgi:hypothetical protein